MNKSGLVEWALAALGHGNSPVAVVLPSKQPRKGLTWTDRQTTLPDEDTIRREFTGSNGNQGLAIIAGAVSGNLEIIDFDLSGEFYHLWINLVEAESPGLINRLAIQQTMNGGFHVLSRCRKPVPGNTKLARKKIEVSGPDEHEYQGKKYKPQQQGEKWVICPVAIETRGQGGYAVVSPSPGYSIIQPRERGEFYNFPEITAAERDILIRCARALDEQPPEPIRATKEQSGGKPGEDFNTRGNVLDILLEHGWKLAGQTGNRQHWTRPGKERGISATSYDDKVLHVFSSNALPLEADKSYSPFAIYTILEHSGDFSAAAKALAKEGYGDQPQQDIRTSPEQKICNKILDPNAAFGGFTVPKEYIDGIGNEQFVIDNLVIKNHILTIIGESGAGKTAFFYFYVAPFMADRDFNVWYIDADSPPSDHKRMKAFCDQHKFNWIIPDVREGQDVGTFMKKLADIAASQCDLNNWVLIFDTLKKFTDVMSKSNTKSFFVLMRKLTKLGATIILLGHANKYRNADGNLIFEGINDVRSDTDEMIMFSTEKAMDDGIDVTTIVDNTAGAKVRGLFRPFSFHIDPYREITFYESVRETVDTRDPNSIRATDLDILDTATAYLKQIKKPVKKQVLAAYVKDKVTGAVGINRVRKVLEQHAVMKGQPQPIGTRFSFTVGDKNAHFFELEV